jgi:hypothetical protein
MEILCIILHMTDLRLNAVHLTSYSKLVAVSTKYMLCMLVQHYVPDGGVLPMVHIICPIQLHLCMLVSCPRLPAAAEAPGRV